MTVGQRLLARSARTEAIRAALFAWLALSTVIGVVLSTPRILMAALIPQIGWMSIPIALALAAALMFALPLERVGEAIVTELRGNEERGRLRNVAEEVSIAIGERPGRVVIHGTDFPNIGAFPTSDGVVVLATAGALAHLQRDELEALVAAQLAGMRDRWCRLATRAELGWQLAKMLAFVMLLATPFTLFVAGALVMIPRMVEATRDLCADVAAVAVTRHPEALASGLRRLGPASANGHEQRLVSWYLPISTFLVLPKRGGTARTTITRSDEVTRSWTAAEEVSAELALRADRAEALAMGADPRQFIGREYVRRWSKLGKDAAGTNPKLFGRD